MKKGLVIAGFAGVGKTTLAKKYQNVIDLESSNYKWNNVGLEDIPVEKRKGIVRKENENWPQNYLDAINDACKKYDIVLVWIHPDVLDIYDKYNIKYMLCFPTKNSLQEYKNRFINRGNNKEFIDKVINTYDLRYSQFKNKNKEEIILDGNETLEDWLLKNNYKLIER